MNTFVLIMIIMSGIGFLFKGADTGIYILLLAILSQLSDIKEKSNDRAD